MPSTPDASVGFVERLVCFLEDSARVLGEVNPIRPMLRVKGASTPGYGRDARYAATEAFFDRRARSNRCHPTRLVVLRSRRIESSATRTGR